MVMLYQTCKLCVPYVTICWGIFFKRNNTGTMFNWPTPLTTNSRLRLASVRADTLFYRIRERGIHGEADPDEEEPVLGDPEDGGAEEERGSAREQRQHQRCEQQPRPWARPSQADSESFQCTDAFFKTTRLRTSVQLSVHTFAVNLSLPWLCCADFSYVFSSNRVLHNPNHQSGECPWD